MTVNIIKKIIPGSFMHRLNNGIKPSGEYCFFCGCEKNSFHSPISDRTTILMCICERDYEMLKKFLDANSDWLSNPGNLPKDVINYKGSGADYSKHHLDCVIKAKAAYLRLQDLKAENKERFRGVN